MKRRLLGIFATILVLVLPARAIAQISVGSASFPLAASAARTATFTGVAVTTSGARGLYLFVSVTAISVTPSVTVKIQAKNEAAWEDVVVVTAPLTAVEEKIFFIGRGAATSAGIDELFPVGLPRVFRLQMVHGDADSITYDVQGLVTQ